MIKLDPASVAGKQPPISEETDLLVVGAGPAGIEAALEAAGRGVRVTLVDENPIPLKTMSEDVPLHFGSRMSATVGNQNAVLERMVAANPQLLDASEAGVDVRLGTAVWGLFLPQPTAAWVGDPVAGLADAERAYLVRFKYVIVAAGRRDMGLAFTGWQRPGVMGVTAAYRLATIYEALDSKVAVLVGSDASALYAAHALAERGVHIEAIVERGDHVVGPKHLLNRLTSRGTRVFTRHMVREALGNSLGVTAVNIARLNEQDAPVSDQNEQLPCDTVLLGVAAVPVIDVLEACGCQITFKPERGGHVPEVDAEQRTSIPNLFAVGDCAGIWPSKTLSDAVARQEGQTAAQAIFTEMGLIPESRVSPLSGPDETTRDIAADRIAWVRATVMNASENTPVCQCEEVTAGELLALKPPRYLDSKQCPKPFSRLGADAAHPVNPDLVKRLTRAGMGPCQGRRCREQVAALIAMDAHRPLKSIPLATYRTPVRPLTLAQMAALPESSHMAPHWDSWFGMPTQWIPFWRIESTYSACTRTSNEPVGGE